MVQTQMITIFMIPLGLLPLVAIILAFILLVYYCLSYPTVFSPLAKIPKAHWTSPFFPGWILWKRFRQQELSTAWEAHQRLGPIVRLGPRDLSISCYDEGIRFIYGGGFDKPSYFDFFKYYGFGH